MTFKVSTGLRNHMLVTGSVKSALDNGFIKIYGGVIPASADDAVVLANSPLLCTVSVNSTGTGITLGAVAADGVVTKNTGEVWSGVNVATGTATFYRHVTAADTNVSSTTEKRVQGEIALLGKEFDISALVLTSGATQAIDYYNIAIPTL